MQEFRPSAEFSSCSKNFLSSWNFPHYKYLVEIADYFYVSLNYLVYGKEDIDNISDDVKELLNYYGKLSDIDRGKLLGKAEAFVDLAAERESKERVAEQSKKTAKSDEVAADEHPEQELVKIMHSYYIFTLNGHGFIKKYSGDRLISLNEKYDDILPNDCSAFRCDGRVKRQLARRV